MKLGNIILQVNPNNVQKKLVSFCKDKDIQVVAYCPLGSMAEKRFPNGTHTSNRDPHLDDPILTAIGTKYNKTTVQVVLRYLVKIFNYKLRLIIII